MRVSAIVSVYNGELFIRGALEDLIAQTLFQRGELEVIVINSGSPQGEDPIIRAIAADHPHITYVRTERETIYAAWNRGIGMASGTYLTNANVDDRHRPDALEVLAGALEESGAGVAYGDALITRAPNETLARNSADRVFHWPEYSLRQLLMHSVFGPQPMWRRALHDQIGLFDSSLKIAGDYDFFIRAAWRAGAVHVPQVLGLYYEGGTESQNLERCRIETQQILRRYRAAVPLEDIYPACRRADHPQLARALASWDFAQCLESGPHPDAALIRRLRLDALTLLARSGPRAWLALGALLAARRPHPAIAELPPIAREIIKAHAAG